MKPTVFTNCDLIDISEIQIIDRQREYTSRVKAHVEELAESIRTMGLISPILLDDNNRLIEGECRIRAHQHLGLTKIPYVKRSKLTQTDLDMLELEANLRRLEMTWQENCLGILKVHNLHTGKKTDGRKKEAWGQRATGALLNVSAAHVNQAIKVGERIRAGDQEIINCPSMTKALDVLSQRKSDAATRRLAAISSVPLIDKQASGRKQQQGIITVSSLDVDELASEGRIMAHIEGPAEIVDLNDVLLRADCRDYFNESPGNVFDIIYTDHPYAIEMDSIQEFDGVNTVAGDHDVDENLDQMPVFIEGSYKVLQEDGLFFCFCAWKHFEYLKELGRKVGFKVQDWPITWCKPYGNKNKLPQYNFAKSMEPVVFMRKGRATLTTPKPLSHFECVNPEKKTQNNPFAKPLEFSKWLLETCAKPGMKMLDPYAGEGSLLKAGIAAGMQVVGIERNKARFPRLVEQIGQVYKAMLGPNTIIHFDYTGKIDLPEGE